MDFTVQVEVGPTELMLRHAAAAVQDLREPFTDVIEPSVTQMFADQFATAGQAGGTPWAPLRPSTLAHKERHGRAGLGTLRFSNRLWGSLTKVPAPEGIRVLEPTRYIRGTSVPYASLHQEGFPVERWGRVQFRQAVQVPARPPIPDPVPPRLVDTWAAGVADYIDRQAERGS